MQEQISIVVPIYKVESYLARCVNSLLQQTYHNIEIILVDDGSPDKCGEICDAFSRKDPRVKAYHKENGGLSDARNFGVSKANGKYIAFIDSDDFVADNYIEYLYDLISKHDADIACCCFVQTQADTAPFGANEHLPSEQVFTGYQACQKLFGPLYLFLVVACGKLYKTDIVKKHPFPVGKIHEDEATTGKFFYESRRVVFGNQRLYAYFQNPTSITHTATHKNNPDAVWAIEHRARFYEQHNEKALSKCAWHFLFRFCVTTSLANNGCYDMFLINFDQGKTLSVRTRCEHRLYMFSKPFFKAYFKICLFFGKMARKVKRAWRLLCNN